MQNTQRNALSTLRNMLLSKGQWTILGHKIHKHAGKDAAIVAIQLTGRRGGVAGDQFPGVRIRQGRAFFVLMLVLDVPKEGF